jgi:hypothetical protein
LTTDQRERRLNQLLIFKQRNNDDVTSSDGSLTVPLVATVVEMPKKTKVETLSAVCTKNQNSKTVIKTIIDGGHLGKIIDQK